MRTNAARASDAATRITFAAMYQLMSQGWSRSQADDFLRGQLRPELLQAACADAGHPLTLRLHPGHDHSYYFIASFIGEHVAWHAQALGAASRQRV